MIFIYIFSFLTLKLNIYIKNTFYVKFFFLNYLFHIDTANCIDSLNLSLINKINNIHPVLLYIVFMKIFIKKYFRKVFLYKYYLGIFIYMSLFLGGYWSNQEINWGGWWDWDPIELILFFFNVLLFVYIHLKKIKLIFFKKFLEVFMKIFFFLDYFIIRINFYNSIHNFVSFDYYKNYLYLIYLCINILNIIVIKMLRLRLNFLSNLFLIILVNIYLFLMKVLEKNFFLETLNYSKIIFNIFILYFFKKCVYLLNVWVLDIIYLVLKLNKVFIKTYRNIHIYFNIFMLITILNFLWKYSLFLKKEFIINLPLNIKYNYILKNYFFPKSYLVTFFCSKYIYTYINKFHVSYLYNVIFYMCLKVFHSVSISIYVNIVYVLLFLKKKNF